MPKVVLFNDQQLNDANITDQAERFVLTHMTSNLSNEQKKLKNKVLNRIAQRNGRKIKKSLTEQFKGLNIDIPAVKTLQLKNEKELKTLNSKIDRQERVIDTLTKQKEDIDAPEQISGVFSLEDAIEVVRNRTIFNKKTNRDELVSQNTMKQDISNLRKFPNQFSECNGDIIKCVLMESKIKTILESIKKKNSKISFLRTILVLLEYLHPRTNKISETYIKKMRDMYKEIDEDNRTERSQFKTDENIAIPTFTHYLNKVKLAYGQDSIEYMIAKMYSEFTPRNDYQNMIYVKSMKDVGKKGNYLVDEKGKNMTVVLNTFKTEKVFGKITFDKFSPLTRTLIKFYIEENDIKDNTKLFPFRIDNLFKKVNNTLGIKDGAIGLFRHMRVSSFMDKNPNTQQRQDLANEMGHSLQTQKEYIRVIDKKFFIKKK